MGPIIVIPALGDNYIYLYHYAQDKALVVDPGQSTAVLKILKNNGLILTDILVTHNHFDHTGGVKDLQRKTGCKVVTPNKHKILNQADINIEIIATPGHTQDSVCFYIRPSENNKGVLFTGDTLFIGGCGRPIGGNPSVLWDSLQKLSALPDDTLVYPGHDYTEENYEFALTIIPDNKIERALQETRELQRLGKLTVPSTIGREKQTNIFLRSGEPDIKTAIGMVNANSAEVFSQLRLMKNKFG